MDLLLFLSIFKESPTLPGISLIQINSSIYCPLFLYNIFSYLKSFSNSIVFFDNNIMFDQMCSQFDISFLGNRITYVLKDMQWSDSQIKNGYYSILSIIEVPIV